MLKIISRLRKDENGAALTEFAFILPVLVLALLGVLDGWSLANSVAGMRAGVDAAARYISQGGTDYSAASSIGLQGWADPPQDANISISRSCACSGGAASCSVVCSDSKPPDVLVSIVATGSWTAPFDTGLLPMSRPLQNEQVIRVR